MSGRKSMEQDLKSILAGLRHISAQLEKMNSGEARRSLGEDWQCQSKDTTSIQTALCAAQSQMPSLFVDSSGYTGKYVSLPGIIAHIQKPLTSNGLCYTQEITELNNFPYVITTLRHESGEWIRSKTPLFFPKREEVPNNKDYNQECGKAISYMRRYALESIIGLKADRDDFDGK